MQLAWVHCCQVFGLSPDLCVFWPGEAMPLRTVTIGINREQEPEKVTQAGVRDVGETPGKISEYQIREQREDGEEAGKLRSGEGIVCLLARLVGNRPDFSRLLGPIRYPWCDRTQISLPPPGQRGQGTGKGCSFRTEGSTPIPGALSSPAGAGPSRSPAPPAYVCWLELAALPFRARFCH